jgi:diguanylate cyclase (GGDEF)-like protein
MADNINHEIELYLLETFKVLLEHEVRKSRRYRYPLTLIRIGVNTEPNTPQTQHTAEMIAINALDSELRESDIPCRDGHEFLVLLPSTDEKGGRSACERLEKLLNTNEKTSDGVAFQVTAFIGLACTFGGPSLSSIKLREDACSAMEYARANGLTKTVLFSEVAGTSSREEN